MLGVCRRRLLVDYSNRLRNSHAQYSAQTVTGQKPAGGKLRARKFKRVKVIVVEGFNDVIHLDNLGIPSDAICSNRMTEQQADKLTRWARQLSGGKVVLMFDGDACGVADRAIGVTEGGPCLINRFLDQDGDGSIMDDLANIGMKFLSRK